MDEQGIACMRALCEFYEEVMAIIELDPKVHSHEDVVIRLKDLMETEFMYDDLCDGDHRGEDQ
jgi:hypothetical protein